MQNEIPPEIGSMMHKSMGRDFVEKEHLPASDDVIAALERALSHLESDQASTRESRDAATIRAHIEALQAGRLVRREDVELSPDGT